MTNSSEFLTENVFRFQRKNIVIKERHERKLTRLTIGQQEFIKKKWVINLSERELDNNEINLLRKGMNVAITPRNIPIKQIIASVEEGISELPQADKDQIRSQVYSTIKEARPPVKKNISRKEKKAMNDLKGDNDIVIIKDDKGNAVVVMDRKDYEGNSG